MINPILKVFPLVLLVLAGCSSLPANPDTTAPASTAIDSFGANPNPSPSNVGTQFSWTVFGRNLVCQLDVEGNGTTDYTVQECTSNSRVIHIYGVQGSFNARLSVTGADGQTVQQTAPVMVSAPNTPPSIPSLTPAPPPSATDPLAVRFTWVVADFDADVTRCRFDAESDGIWDFDDLCSGLPTIAAVGKASSVTYSLLHGYKKPGTYQAILEAADPYVSTRSQVKVRVPWNRVPVIESLKAVAAANNTATVGFDVSDPDKDVLSCKLSVESIGTFNYPNCRNLTRSFTFTSSGKYRVSLEVADEFSKTSKSVSLDLGGSSEPEPIPLIPRVDPGAAHTCALTNLGKLYCWGNDYNGPLGQGTAGTGNQTSPLEVQGYTFHQTSISGDVSCALTALGKAYCWGLNDLGQVGSGGTATNYGLPQPVAGGLSFKQISTNSYHVCGLTAAGVAYCWGENTKGQLGTGDTINQYTPQPVKGGLVFKQISSGQRHTCGITVDGETNCWGENSFGALGVGDNSDRLLPTPVLGYTFVQISAGSEHTCAITTLMLAYCWGYNFQGQLGIGTSGVTADTNSPTQVSGSIPFSYIEAAESSYTCGLTDLGAAYCWGDNAYGQLGDSSTIQREVPTAVAGSYTFKELGTSDYAVCAATITGTPYCWGKNTFYNLGNGNNVDQSSPAAVQGGLAF
jgi:alpha-tubulin suppressor-like RCC1 family protein